MSCVDVHFHIIPPFYPAAAAAAGRRPSTSSGTLPPWSPELALAVMDDNGIATAITSMSSPGVHFGDDVAARELARRCNEFARDLRTQWPTRFGNFAVLPLPDVAGACTEIEYAFDHLGADGVLLFANYAGRFLGDPAFDPVMDALNRRSAVVFVHPAIHPATAALSLNVPAFVIEFPFDTTRAAVNLIFSGSLDRYPNIRFILAHAGGTLPYLSWRLSAAPEVDPGRFKGIDAEAIRRHLRNFWYDVALAADPHTVALLADIAGPDHILFGSDWPFAPASITARAVRTLEQADTAAHVALRRANAQKLFPRGSFARSD